MIYHLFKVTLYPLATYYFSLIVLSALSYPMCVDPMASV